jgi:hypothetical protein
MKAYRNAYVTSVVVLRISVTEIITVRQMKNISFKFYSIFLNYLLFPHLEEMNT